MSLEKVVRPFQTGEGFTARSNVPVQPAVPPNDDQPSLSWNGGQSSTYTEAPEPGSLGFQAKWEEDKSRRVTSEIKVTNPDDDSQYVKIKRIDSTVFKNNVTGAEMPIKMDWRDD